MFWKSLFKYVDPKKLEKVNEKAKKKLDKAEGKVESNSAQSNLSNYDSSKAASASQSLSKKTEAQNESDSNRNFDICIENFDVSFGNKWALFNYEVKVLTFLYNNPN